MPVSAPHRLILASLTVAGLGLVWRARGGWVDYRGAADGDHVALPVLLGLERDLAEIVQLFASEAR